MIRRIWHQHPGTLPHTSTRQPRFRKLLPLLEAEEEADEEDEEDKEERGGRLVALTPVAASHCKRMALSLRKQSAFIMSYQRGATPPSTPSSLLLQLLFSLVLPAPLLLHLLSLLPPPPLPLSPLYLLLLLSGSQEEESEQEVKV